LVGLGLADVLGGLFVGISAVSVYTCSKRYVGMPKQNKSKFL
jgi:hypothetical protein